MEPSSRTTHEQRGGMRDDNTGTGGQWDNSMGKGGQGKWEDAFFVHATFEWASTAAGFMDNIGGRGGDTYTPGQGGGFDDTTGGGQTGTGLGIQSDRHATSGQYGGAERVGQTGHADPSARNTSGGGGGMRPDDDDEYGASIGSGGGGPKGKPSMTSKVKGAAEQMTGKMMGDQGKQSRGREREEGNF